MRRPAFSSLAQAAAASAATVACIVLFMTAAPVLASDDDMFQAAVLGVDSLNNCPKLDHLKCTQPPLTPANVAPCAAEDGADAGANTACRRRRMLFAPEECPGGSVFAQVDPLGNGYCASAACTEWVPADGWTTYPLNGNDCPTVARSEGATCVSSKTSGPTSVLQGSTNAILAVFTEVSCAAGRRRLGEGEENVQGLAQALAQDYLAQSLTQDALNQASIAQDLVQAGLTQSLAQGLGQDDVAWLNVVTPSSTTTYTLRIDLPADLNVKVKRTKFKPSFRGAKTPVASNGGATLTWPAVPLLKPKSSRKKPPTLAVKLSFKVLRSMPTGTVLPFTFTLWRVEANGFVTDVEQATFSTTVVAAGKSNK